MANGNNVKKTQPRKMPFLIRMAAWGTAILLCLAFSAIIALHIPSIQKRIILKAVTRIETATNLKVQIGSYRWTPLSSIYLTGVKIESEGRRIFDCDNVRLSYRLSIERPYIIIKEVYLQKPFLELERSTDGKWLVPVTPAGNGQREEVLTGNKPPEPLWTHLQLPKIKIFAGTIEARQQGNTVFTIKDISGAVNLRALRRAEGPKIQIDFQKIHARAQNSEWGAWDIDGSGLFDGQKLLVRSMLLSGPNNCRIKVHGQWDVQNLNNGKANLIITNFSADTVPFLKTNLSGLSAVSGSIVVTRSEGRWTFKHDVSTDLGSVKGVLYVIKTPAGPYDVRLDSRFADLKVHLSRDMPDSRLNGRMKIEGLIEGENLLNAKFTARLDPSTLGTQKVQLCDLNGTFADSILNVTGSNVKSSLADFKFKLKADLRGLSDARHKGVIEARIDLERGNLREIDSRLRDKVAGRISVEADYDPGNFADPKLWQAKIDATLNIPETLSLKGSATYNNQQVKAEYNLDLADAQKIGLLFPKWRGKGRVVSHGSFSGKWPDLFWNGEIDSPHFQYANFQADRLAVKGKGKVVGKEERHEISLKAQNVVLDGKRLASVDMDVDQQKNSCTFRFNGDGILDKVSARLSGKVDRVWEFPHVFVSTQGQLDWKKLSGTVNAKFDIGRDGIRIDSASLRHGSSKISASGGAISESSIKLLLSMDSINAAMISKLLNLKERLSGTISGRMQVSGRPEQPECRLSVQGKNFLYGKQQIDALTLQGNYSKEILSVQGTAKAAGVRNPMVISAKIPIQFSFEPPQFDVKASEKFQSDIKVSGLNAGAVLPLMDFLSKAGGQVDGDIHCGGTLKQPVVSGAGTWKNGFFEAKRWPHAAKDIQADWQVDSKDLYIKNAKISHLGGTVTVTGRIDYPRFKTLDFKADGKDLEVPDIYGMKGKVSGHVEIKASPEAAKLTGTLHFSKARLGLSRLETNITQDKSIQIVESTTSGDLLVLKGAEGPSQFFNKLSMDVMLELPPSGTWITGKGLKAEINGSVKLEKKPAGSVMLAGELHALRGVYTFQGKQLKIVEGSLIFPGTPQMQPQLRILCRKDVKDVTVQALVSGPIKQPKLVLSSIPVMNQVDILSYFMFDRPAGDLSTNQSSQLQSGVAALLGSEGSNIIKSILGNKFFTPDTVSYRSFTGNYDHRFSFDESQAESSKETGIVEIGKDITPNLHVVYGREVKGAEGNGNEVQVEYRVNKAMSVRSQVGGEQSGVDIFWRHDFGK